VTAPSDSPSSARLDKWLWALRLFKTRPLATAACKAGFVTVNELVAKPARDVRPGERIGVRQGLVQRSLVVLGSPKGRVSAKQVKDYCEDHTPPGEFEKARTQRVQHLLEREKGTGRPTKRDRRLIDHLLGGD
jgi:ribosome-associated heat shock protein Hsp15